MRMVDGKTLGKNRMPAGPLPRTAPAKRGGLPGQAGPRYARDDRTGMAAARLAAEETPSGDDGFLELLSEIRLP